MKRLRLCSIERQAPVHWPRWLGACGALSVGCSLVFPYEDFEPVDPIAQVCALYDAAPGSCAGDFRDCNGDAADGCETQIDVDPSHCGYCGHPCGGAACDMGLCAAVSLTAMQPEAIDALGVHQGFLYFTTYDEGIHVVPPAGGAQPLIAGFGGSSSHLAFDGDYAYALGYSPGICMNNSGWCVIAMPVGESAASVLAESLDYPFGLAIGGAYAFFADHGDGGRVVRVDKTGAGTALMTTGEDIAALASDGVHVYWAGAGGVKRVAVDAAGAAPEVIDGTSSGAVALSADQVYWASSNAILRMPKGGGGIEVVVDGMPNTTWIGLSGAYLYWTADALYRRVMCATGQNDDLAPPGPAYVTADRVYHVLGTAVVERAH